MDLWFWFVGLPTLGVSSLFVIGFIVDGSMAFFEYLGWKARTPYVG